MLNTIILSSLIVLLVVNWILDIKSRKARNLNDSKVHERINTLTRVVNNLNGDTGVKALSYKFKELEKALKTDINQLQQHNGFRMEQTTKEIEFLSRTIDSIQEKIAELEVSMQNNHNNLR
jgi:hypothetical protein